MNPKRAPTAASTNPAADNFALDAAAPLLGELEAEAAPPDAEALDVPLAVGVADEAGYSAPAALISNGCDWA